MYIPMPINGKALKFKGSEIKKMRDLNFLESLMQFVTFISSYLILQFKVFVNFEKFFPVSFLESPRVIFNNTEEYIP